MGGHGALTLFLKYPGMYKSVSAFAPIANPSNCPWGEKAFKGYLGEDREAWKKHDATELIRGVKAGTFAALIDVGTGDNFYKQGQLLPENFEKAAEESGNDKGLVLRYQDVSDDLGVGQKDDRKCSRKTGLRSLILFHLKLFDGSCKSCSQVFVCGIVCCSFIFERESMLKFIEAAPLRVKSYRIKRQVRYPTCTTCLVFVTPKCPKCAKASGYL